MAAGCGVLGQVVVQRWKKGLKDLVPVVEASAAQIFLGDRKAEWTDQAQARSSDSAQAGDIAGVGGNLGFDEHNGEWRLQRGQRHEVSSMDEGECGKARRQQGHHLK